MGFTPYVPVKRLTSLGSYGALPTPVRKFCDDLTTDVEANPDKFHYMIGPKRMREARARIAKMIGAKPEECVFVTNASIGMTTILRNFEWHEEDTIVKSMRQIFNMDSIITMLTRVFLSVDHLRCRRTADQIHL